MDYYIVARQSPHYHQMTLEEFLLESFVEPVRITNNYSNTRTCRYEEIPKKILDAVGVQGLISRLESFNKKYEDLHKVENRSDLYYTFYIPKNSGGYRKIDAPEDELSEALRELKKIFEDRFNALYHTSAFAYVKKRSTIDCIKRHQANESKWFAHYDVSNFFGSVTKDFTMKMLSMIFPFSEVIKVQEGFEELSKAVDLCFLDGVLPQGTPISPMLTNIIMIPLDHKLYNTLRDFEKQSFVYTRYADDFIISSKYDFKFRDIENLIRETFAEFKAPFKIKPKKTRYGSTAGANWNLGLMLNKDNEITVGWKVKKQFKNALRAFARDYKNGVIWDIHDVQILEGQRNYYRNVEGESIADIVKHEGDKANVDIAKAIDSLLRSA